MFYVFFVSRDDSYETHSFDNISEAYEFYDKCIINPDIICCVLNQILCFYKEEEDELSV